MSKQLEAFPSPRIVGGRDVRLALYEHLPSNGSGTPVMMLHGFPELAYSWRYQLPALAAAGFRAYVFDQRGYGLSDRPGPVHAYDIVHLTDDVCRVLDGLNIDKAVIAGHDWGAIVTWSMAQLHPDRVLGVAALSVPYLERGPSEPVGFWESRLGPDFYIVHFNRQPGVADAAFARNPRTLLRNLYRRYQWKSPRPAPKPGMAMINLVDEPTPLGDSLMSDSELDVFVAAFERTGFTGPINWYRNFTRNYDLMAAVDPHVRMPALMIYGQYDMVGKNDTMGKFVHDLEVHTLPCGHWIQQEEAVATNRLMIDWLNRRFGR